LGPAPMWCGLPARRGAAMSGWWWSSASLPPPWSKSTSHCWASMASGSPAPGCPPPRCWVAHP
jgi:hypothetical protein